MHIVAQIIAVAAPWEEMADRQSLVEHVVRTLRLCTPYPRDALRAATLAVLDRRLQWRGRVAADCPRGVIEGGDLMERIYWPGFPIPEAAQAASVLVCHDHDTDRLRGAVRRRVRNIERIQAIPQHAQKSVAWLEQRQGCLTATAVAIALDEDKYKYPVELFLDKCGRGPPFLDNANVHHGRKYEEIGTLFYSFRMNVVVGEYGLIQHPEHTYVGASPDGICHADTPDHTGYSNLAGRLLEIKFPRLRKIKTRGREDGDLCPHYYHRQVETQLYALGFDECDFLQCDIEEYQGGYREWLADTHPVIPGLSATTHLEKGCLIQMLPIKQEDTEEQRIWKSEYIYPPRLHMSHAETEAWIGQALRDWHLDPRSSEYVYDRVIYWRLKQISCITITLPEDWEEDHLPTLRQYWDYVLWAREDQARLDRICQAISHYEPSQSAEIWTTIHRLYTQDHPKTEYLPLYTSTNAWRAECERQKAYWRR